MDEQLPMSADELLDIVDENDQVIGQARRAEAYARRLRHRCVFVLARDADGRIFVHRRTASKLVFPALCDMFVGGVVGAGESYDEAALRETEEGLGVRGLPAPVPLFRFLYETPEHTWWSALYEVRCPTTVAPQPEEVAWHTFLTEAGHAGTSPGQPARGGDSAPVNRTGRGAVVGSDARGVRLGAPDRTVR